MNHLKPWLVTAAGSVLLAVTGWGIALNARMAAVEAQVADLRGELHEIQRALLSRIEQQSREVDAVKKRLPREPRR